MIAETIDIRESFQRFDDVLELCSERFIAKYGETIFRKVCDYRWRLKYHLDIDVLSFKEKALTIDVVCVINNLPVNMWEHFTIGEIELFEMTESDLIFLIQEKLNA